MLTSRNNYRFLGKEERKAAFKLTLKQLCPKLRVIDVSGESDIIFETLRILHRAVKNLDHLCAVYSMGGGNHIILNALEQNELLPDIFIAHDLNKNMYHDLIADLENVFHAFLHYHKLTKDLLIAEIYSFQIVTPENITSKEISNKICF